LSRRTEQISSTLQQAVQTVLSRGLHDPRVRGLITVTKVDVEPDLSRAKVWVSVFPRERQELTLHGLQSAAKHIRHAVGEGFAAKRVPDLVFEADLAAQRQADVLHALAKARDELRDESRDGDTDRTDETSADEGGEESA
jgi:ribosome-binding factor A